MKYLISGIITLFSFYLVTDAQVKQAHVDKSGKIFTTEHPHFHFPGTKNKSKQPVPWPKAFVPNQSFKNFRGVCLEDINHDGKDEIITGINDSIYVLSGEGDILWSHYVEGTAIYPPSAADINGDGEIEIVLNTGGSPANGRVYVFDHEGNVLEGWPVNFNDHWMTCAPALADINGDGIMQILTAERVGNDLPGKLHVLNPDGTSFSENWPQEMDGIPAVTPTAGYFEGNSGTSSGADIIMCSTTGLYAFNIDGSQKNGFPVERDSVKYSYQSPLLVHSESESKLFSATDNFIAGAKHGDLPGFYCMDTSGNMLGDYPVLTADSNWTYGAPTCIGSYCNIDFLLNGQPGANGEGNYPAIYYDNGSQNGFFERFDGLEGFITAIECSNQDGYYVFTGSNLKTETGLGFVHAYHMENDGTDVTFTELSGFPKMVPGFTFVNGINVGDTDGDEYPELVVLSYDQDMSEEDSTYINVFDFDEQPYDPDKAYPTYKGDNTRAGEVRAFQCPGNSEIHTKNALSIYPNPVKDILFIELEGIDHYRIYNITGHCIMQAKQPEINQVPVSELPSGIYFIEAGDSFGRTYYSKFTKL
ncbi:MAG: T9SS type A sorting domain-containing protein [Bacteroidales bacterium]